MAHCVHDPAHQAAGIQSWHKRRQIILKCHDDEGNKAQVTRRKLKTLWKNIHRCVNWKVQASSCTCCHCSVDTVTVGEGEVCMGQVGLWVRVTKTVCGFQKQYMRTLHTPYLLVRQSTAHNCRHCTTSPPPPHTDPTHTWQREGWPPSTRLDMRTLHCTGRCIDYSWHQRPRSGQQCKGRCTDY